MGAAVNIFLRQVIIHHGLSFKVNLEPIESVEELMKDLDD